MSGLYFEDFTAGRRFAPGTCTLSRDEVIAFARAFDPQPFHLDDEAAARSLFGSLAASGWHTAALVAGTLARGLGLDRGGGYRAMTGFEDLRWPRPVRPGDLLSVGAEVIATDPGQDRVTLRVEAVNQAGDLVCRYHAHWLVDRRPAP